jgi:hypothetical protein
MAPNAAAASANPYLQSMYAAAAAANNPYAMQGTNGLISLAQNPMVACGQTGNPLLDAYSQYAALAAAGVYTTAANTGVTLSEAINAQASKLILYLSLSVSEKKDGLLFDIYAGLLSQVTPSSTDHNFSSSSSSSSPS